MKPQIRTTAALIGAAGTFVAAAVLIQRSPPASASSPSTTSHEADPPKATCKAAGDAHGTMKIGPATLEGALSAGAIMQGGGGDVYASFEITTDNAANAQRPALDLALVIDRSGSMSDGRIEHAQTAAIGIVERLSAADHVALVQYDDNANVVVASTAMDDAGKARMKSAIRGIQLGGSTNLHGGLVLGRDEVQRTLGAQQVSRVILLSDGQANAGVVDPHQIADTARLAANQGIRITSVGIGLDFNEDLMEAIAEAGRGQYHYVKVASDLDKVIAGELAGIQATVATSVELHLKAPCAGVQVAEVLGYESRRDGDTVIVPMADLSGNDSRKLLVKLHVPDAEKGKIGAVYGELVFKDASGGEVKRTAVSLGVDRTDDGVVAAASVDKDVMAQVIQLDAAKTIREAAQAYEKGDSARAMQVIEASRKDIASKSARYKIAPKKSAEVLDELEGMSAAASTYAPSSAEGKAMLKSTKSKARVMSKK